MNSTWPETEASDGPSYFTSMPSSLPISMAPLPPDSKKPTPVSLGMNAIFESDRVRCGRRQPDREGGCGRHPESLTSDIHVIAIVLHFTI